MLPSGKARILGSLFAENRTNLHLAVRPQNPASRRHLFDDALAVADLRHRFEMLLSFSRRGSHTRNRLSRILDRKKLVRQPSLDRNRLGQEIATRRIVLMKRMNANPIDRRLARLGNRLAKRIVPFVADADPIERDQHHRRLLIRLQNNPASRQRIVHPSRRRHKPIAQRRPRRRRHIDLERRNAKINGLSTSKRRTQTTPPCRTSIRNPKSEIRNSSPSHFAVPCDAAACCKNAIKFAIDFLSITFSKPSGISDLPVL